MTEFERKVLDEMLVHGVVIRLDRQLSRTRRKRFATAMRHALADRGYAMAQWRMVLVVLPLWSVPPQQPPHDVLGWLIDQREVVKVWLLPPKPLLDVIHARVDLLVDEQSKDPERWADLRPMLAKVADGAVLHALTLLRTYLPAL